MSLHYNYEVPEVYGIKWGYKGIYTDTENTWLRLTPDLVKNIHKEGGTILGSSRGHPDRDKLLDELIKREITQVYVIGGDGTHMVQTSESPILYSQHRELSDKAHNRIPPRVQNGSNRMRGDGDECAPPKEERDDDVG